MSKTVKRQRVDRWRWHQKSREGTGSQVGTCCVAREAKREGCSTDQKAAEPSSRVRVRQEMRKYSKKGSRHSGAS